ncbi:hypothetical protein LEAN103870_14295 [Legionella anisa]|uniref:Uncharacterized protein n=1 Tax=Legionella anisa TaxID=28082 RepID=A0AAX0WS74_9GAMM|nr:hypothetical protein [Legionella anisa]AWN74633.1 hypothetical protein DLD14_12720 [Legionella anisa]KTC76242.1 hypothetical protein Lani_0531 [Legionella anisa]MBN5937138.1 hypothetical protein [Legionella anisa]MCW8425248.1 hypothetical protein [Legionella anisa]MCW8449322.1 hypothetical protein [Legionella anisa]
MEAFHTEKQKGTVKPPKSTPSDAIATITRDFQIYNGAKDRIKLEKGGVKQSGYLGNEEEVMKACEAKITALLDAKGWTKYFALPYQDIPEAIKNDRKSLDMTKEDSENLIKLCRNYCHDFQKFENKLQSEVSKLPEEDNNITAPSFQ